MQQPASKQKQGGSDSKSDESDKIKETLDKAKGLGAGLQNVTKDIKKEAEKQRRKPKDPISICRCSCCFVCERCRGLGK